MEVNMSDFLHRFARICHAGQAQPAPARQLYSQDIAFTDPLHEVQGLAQLRSYFAELYSNVSQLRFDFHGFDQVAEGEGYLRWKMSFCHPRLANGQVIRVEGCSHLMWRDKVYRHRDYFDAGAMLYEHLPVLGRVSSGSKGEWDERRVPPRRYWLTGASSGIGAHWPRSCSTSGAHLALSSRTLAPLDALAQRYPGQVLVVAGDLTNSQTVREIGEHISEVWGSLDTVILNAGTCEYVDARQFDSSIIEHVVRTNLLASSYCIEAALPLLRVGSRRIWWALPAP